ncbi:MAG: amidohydrolase [Chitinophagaceae bacterium]|nr:amidohydrolase [Chitinophagaceae bacterium]
MKHLLSIIFTFTITLLSSGVSAQKKKPADPADRLKAEAVQDIQSKAGLYKSNAMEIWNFAEVGYKEVKSAALLQQTLKNNGFTVEAGVAGIPTAFVATYGSGKPVIGILAEYDALPGMSQEAIPEKKSINGKNAGHACGHHLFGTASVAAGVSIKKLIEEKKISGTVKVLGCPAEEGGSGKVYMVRAGLFNDMDAVIHWHPGDDNEVTMTSALANKSAKFRFKGIAAHASGAPDKGRSALDAVEAMNVMANMMREHIPQEARLHYVITNGGKAPNIVPDFAEVYYYVRHPRKEEAKAIFERIVKAARGAALGTETTMDYEIIGGTHDMLLNKTLGEVMQKNLDQTGGVAYTAEEIEFAEKIQSTFTFKAPAIGSAAGIKPFKTTPDAGGGSTDVGDVSYAVPTVGMSAATWVPGTPAHSWQAVTAGGTDIGVKGMMVAAKTMAMTAIDLYINPAIITKATEEFKTAKGNYKYEALLGDREPALNYRD